MLNKIKISLNAPEELNLGIKRLESVLNFEITDKNADITIEAKASDKTSVKIENGTAVITYAKKHIFFRELSVVLEHCGDSSFELYEDDYFKTVSVIL